MSESVAPQKSQALLGGWEPVYRSRLHYLVTWGTRGRKPVLKEKHQLAFQQLASRVCEERGIPLLEVSTASEHIHLLFSLKPTQSAASAVRELKGRTGLDLMSAFPELRVWLGGNLAWDEHYAVETVSPARLDRVRSGLRTRHASQDLGLARAS